VNNIYEVSFFFNLAILNLLLFFKEGNVSFIIVSDHQNFRFLYSEKLGKRDEILTRMN